jgi:hypothetical protein
MADKRHAILDVVEPLVDSGRWPPGNGRHRRGDEAEEPETGRARSLRLLAIGRPSDSEVPWPAVTRSAALNG